MFEGKMGERGARGDMGHDGPRGERGHSGPDDLERIVVETTTKALVANQHAERLEVKRLKLTDARLLVIFVLLVAFLAGLAYLATGLIRVCEANNTGNAKVNGFLSAAARTAETAPGRTPEQRAAISEQYRAFMLPVVDCPP